MTVGEFVEILETAGWDEAVYDLKTDDPDVALICEIYKMAYRTSDYQRTGDPDEELCWKIRNFCIENIIDLLERKEKAKMPKYCEIAGQVTNCTDNCKSCLEEETETHEIKVGDRVRYIAEDSNEDKETGFYPPKGTIGTVIWIGNDSDQCYIRWPEGTTKGGVCRYTEKETVELVD